MVKCRNFASRSNVNKRSTANIPNFIIRDSYKESRLRLWDLAIQKFGLEEQAKCMASLQKRHIGDMAFQIATNSTVWTTVFLDTDKGIIKTPLCRFFVAENAHSVHQYALL